MAADHELLQQALEALLTCETGGYRDIDGDWRETRWFDKDKVDAAIKALTHGVREDRNG